MASRGQTVDASIHTTGGAWRVSDAQIVCDRSRAPQIEATVTLTGPPKAVIDALMAGDELLFVIEARSYDGGTLADLAESWAGQTLGSLTFATVPTTYATYGTTFQAEDTSWRYRSVRLWPAEGTRWDRMTRTLEFRATSIEGVLQQRQCLDESGWLSNGTRSSTGTDATLEGIVRQLTSHLGVPLPIARGSGLGGVDRPYYDAEAQSKVPPLWEFGQTAWDFIDSLRATCGVTHIIDSASGDLAFSSSQPDATTALEPDAPIEWATDQAPLDAEGGYADAIAATFHWQEWDAETEDVVSREQVMVELADGVTRWQDARAAVSVDYNRRPNRSYVQRDLRLRNLTRYLTTTVEAASHHLINPSTRNPFLYWFDPDGGWSHQSVQFTFPDATVTVMTRETSIL